MKRALGVSALFTAFAALFTVYLLLVDCPLPFAVFFAAVWSALYTLYLVSL